MYGWGRVETTYSCYNTITHQTTPPLLRMLHSMLQATKQLQSVSTSYDPVLTPSGNISIGSDIERTKERTKYLLAIP